MPPLAALICCTFGISLELARDTAGEGGGREAGMPPPAVFISLVQRRSRRCNSLLFHRGLAKVESASSRRGARSFVYDVCRVDRPAAFFVFSCNPTTDGRVHFPMAVITSNS